MSKHIFLLAGEASGDALGGALMESFKRKIPDVKFSGVGGTMMQGQGLDSLVDMEELCVMGLIEVLEHLPRLNKLIQGMVEEVEKRQPDTLVTIDLPDFNFRVAERLKKRGIFKGKIYHYVAPTVWAWRPGRAKKIAQYLDGVMCLFPFEPPYFEKWGLAAEYVGHPMIETDVRGLELDLFKEQFEVDPDALKIGVFFGSRESELKRHSETILEAVELVQEQVDNVQLLVMTLPDLYLEVVNLMQGASAPYVLFANPDKKWEAIGCCDVAVAVSGTVGLELAYANVPHVIGYKMNPISWILAKILVKSKYAHLANIFLDTPIVPEFLQSQFKAPKIAKALIELHKKPEVFEAQRVAFKGLAERMSLPDGVQPSDKAVDFILSGKAASAAETPVASGDPPPQ